MGDESAEEVEKLKTLLDEAKAAIEERERQLAETKTKLDEAEGTFAAERDEQVAAVRLECELDKLRDIEALRKNFDKERQAWSLSESVILFSLQLLDCSGVLLFFLLGLCSRLISAYKKHKDTAFYYYDNA